MNNDSSISWAITFTICPLKTMSESKAIARRTFLLGLLGLGGSLILPHAQANIGSFKPFSFAFISDCHLITGVSDSYKLTQESQLFLQNAIKQINNLSLDFVLFGGDQVDLIGNDEVNWQLFIDVAQSLNCPWSFILGERDVSGITPVDKLKTYGRDWKGKGLAGQTSYWSQDVMPGIHLIGLDTSRANSTIGELSSEQLSWLQADLDNHKGKFTIVMSHHPLLPPPPFDGGPPWDDYLVVEGASAREILNTSPSVRLALSGHVHVSKIDREKDIWYVCSNSLDVYPCTFRVFHVNQESITVETYQIDYPALLKKARISLTGSALAFDYNKNRPAAFAEAVEGGSADQNARLPLAAGKPIEPIKRPNPPKPLVKAKPHTEKKKPRKEKEKPAKEKNEKKETRATSKDSEE